MAKAILIGVIRSYKKLISPFLPHSCRYYPTCSTYCIEAVEKYGFAKGSLIGLKRILRCNRFFEGGFDPLS
ncbi:MAG: membrane protein insertion efficiency factor YidD [Candidatus Margulisiibacteriota bacterium]